jgi:two-component system nitrogen regulation sensor histidine kinase GlnL
MKAMNARRRLALVTRIGRQGAGQEDNQPASPTGPSPQLPGPDPMALLGALPVAAVLLDVDNHFRYANHAAEQFLGISASQLRQHRLNDLVPPDNPIFLLLEQVRRSDATIADHDLTLEGPRLRKEGITVQGAPLPEEPGSVLLVLQDASAARALDRQLSFRGAARSVSGMAAILAHEVKNPLSGIRGAAQLLESSVGAADRELTILIRDEADRIRALVDRMEVFGEKPIERGAVNIHRVLEHVRKLAQSGFAAHLRIAEVYDPSLPPVWGNRDQLIQVMLNLVKNAAEALTGAEVQSGEIVLSTAYQHGVRLAVPGTDQRLHLPLVVSVRDNGPGIPEDLSRHLFEPFVTTKPTGSGLGLALVAKIVGDHGGLIEFDSRPGRTEFRMHLPMLSDDDIPAPKTQDESSSR